MLKPHANDWITVTHLEHLHLSWRNLTACYQSIIKQPINIPEEQHVGSCMEYFAISAPVSCDTKGKRTLCFHFCIWYLSSWEDTVHEHVCVYVPGNIYILLKKQNNRSVQYDFMTSFILGKLVCVCVIALEAQPDPQHRATHLLQSAAISPSLLRPCCSASTLTSVMQLYSGECNFMSQAWIEQWIPRESQRN